MYSVCSVEINSTHKSQFPRFNIPTADITALSKMYVVVFPYFFSTTNPEHILSFGVRNIVTH